MASMICALSLSAKVYKLEGEIGGKYPVVIEMERHEDGLVSGRYAYKSTLRKSGDVPCSWLSINPSYENPASQWTIRDCKPEYVETWYGVKFDGKRLTAYMTNTRGKSYTVEATVKPKPASGASSKASGAGDAAAKRRYKAKYDEVHIADIRIMKADGRKIWYNPWTHVTENGYSNRLYVYDSVTDRETSINLNKTSMEDEAMEVVDMEERNGIITIIMAENRNSNGWVEGTYVWQYDCNRNSWRPLARACSGAKFIKGRKEVDIIHAECLNPDAPTYMKNYRYHHTYVPI